MDRLSLAILLPLIVGFSIVLQGTLNRIYSGNIGMGSAIFMNGVVFFLASLIYWYFNRTVDFDWSQITFSRVPPGLFGFLIVLLTPLSIGYLGVTLTFSLIIASQLILSLMIESFQNKAWPSLTVVAGVVLLTAGVAMIYKKSNWCLELRFKKI